MCPYWCFIAFLLRLVSTILGSYFEAPHRVKNSLAIRDIDNVLLIFIEVLFVLF